MASPTRDVEMAPQEEPVDNEEMSDYSEDDVAEQEGMEVDDAAPEQDQPSGTPPAVLPVPVSQPDEDEGDAKGHMSAEEDEGDAKGHMSAEESEEEPEAGGDEAAAATPAEDSEQAIVEVEKPLAVVPQRGKPRLMIKSIVLENFKSYGGVKEIGPFHKCFSSVVGPNGSGKSNTIDALLFVFGKRAKKIRLNKVSELIHSSSTILKPNSGKVTVRFQDIIDTGDGPLDYEIVPGSQISVSREAFRNNSSKYYMDDQPSNFTDVTTVLRKRGIDLEHNRFLILQGEVEQISLMKPKAQSQHEEGLLEYLEDIVGSNRLVEPIEQAKEVVERFSEVRQEKLNRLKVAEKEREALDGPRREAEAWVVAEKERLELQTVLGQLETRKCHRALEGMEEEYKALQGHMEAHREKMKSFETEVKTIEAEHNARLTDYTGVKTQMEKAAAEFKDFERQDVKFTEDIAFNEQKLAKLRQTVETQKQQSEKLKTDAAQFRKDWPLKEKELESAERYRVSMADKLEAVYKTLKGKAEELRGPHEAKQKELFPLQQRLTEVRKEVEVAQTEAGLLREKTSKVSEQIDDLRKTRDECAQRMQIREQEGQQAAQLKTEREQLVKQAKDRIAMVSTQVETLQAEVGAARVKAEEVKNAFQEESTRGQLIRAVYQQSKAGKLHGVHGRLGDLGTIGKKYDVAVSTACGLLDAIVVNTAEDAQAVIEFIRSNDLGRATCIVLEKIRDKEHAMNAKIDTPGGAPRLVDLIKPAQPEYKVAFFFALQHTLVANDLDHASKIAYQGKKTWRVVTLQGQLIDTSGTMSGGGGQVASGGMRASLCAFSPEEVKAIIDTYERKNAELANLRHEQHSIEEALRMTDKEIEEFDLRSRKCTMDIDSYKKQLDAYDARLKAMKVPQLTDQEKQKLKSLEKLITTRSKDLNEIHAKHHEVEAEVHALSDQIMNVGGEELKTAKWKADEAAKKCEDLRKLIRKLQLDAEANDRNSVKAIEAANQAVNDTATCEQAIKDLRAEHAKLDDKAEAVLNAYNNLKQQLIEKDQMLNQLRAKRDEIIKEASALKSQEVDLVAEVEEKTRILRDCHARVTAWGKKLVDNRKEYSELPLDILRDILCPEREAETPKTLGELAIAGDLDDEQLDSVLRADVEAKVLALEANLKNMRPNLESIQAFRKADAEFKSRLVDFEAANADREKARCELDVLQQKRLEEFMDGFSIISMKLKEMYQMITLGGDAELELVDTLDPFSEGIHFSVRPPKKSWKQITNLSGGEKTLASLSLVFALHHYKPTPLYFMDEIDAALDFRNVSIIANYIKERTKNAQFIIISLRNHMFELADLLVGIYKTQDISKSVAVEPELLVGPAPPTLAMQKGADRVALPAGKPAAAGA